jgi:hypothetical protein
LETYPHHRHDEQGNVKPSPLTGDPVRDIEVVLHEVSTFLAIPGTGADQPAPHLRGRAPVGSVDFGGGGGSSGHARVVGGEAVG